jgi:hypothetical protein
LGGRVVPDEIDTGRPEAHHRDVGALRHAQPLEGIDEEDAEPDTAAGATRPTLAVAFRTSAGSGANGVSTEALTGTHTPYCGFTLTEERRSTTVSAFWVAVEPAAWTA